jgi:hypothetical protein
MWRGFYESRCERVSDMFQVYGGCQMSVKWALVNASRATFLLHSREYMHVVGSNV